jgi:YbbR domain-containing protein
MDVGYRLRALLTENLNLKLLSLAFALVLYSFVHGSEDAQRSLLLNLDTMTPPESSNRVLMTSMPAQVRVTVRGPRSQLDDLHADDMPVQLDLRGGKPRVDIEPSLIKLPPGLKVEQVEPAAIDLQWEDRVDRDVPVEVGIVGTPAPGFMVKGAPTAEPASVRARGPKNEVLLMQHVRADAFDVSGLTENKSRQLAIDRPPPHITYDVSSVNATVEIAREVVERPFTKVPVAVLGRPSPKVQPAEVDVRLVCPPEVVRALRPEQIVPRAQITSPAEHGSDALPVQLTIDQCNVHVIPPSVIVRW